MGTTLTGTTPQDTYDSLIKVTDNGPLSGTAKYLSDGLGNDSALALSTTAVGVGTASPNFPSAGRTVLDINGSSQSMLALSVGGTGKGFVFHTGTDLLISNEGNGPIKFNANAAERAIITAAGNVGIGTSSPTAGYKLDLRGRAITYNSGYLADFVSTESNASSIQVYADNTNVSIVQGGTSAVPLTFFVGGTEKLRIQSGGGISFNGDTAAANALDDYEEGTWTPTLGGTWSTNPTSLSGFYTKIGNMVYIRLEFTGGVKATSVAGWFDGLPFSGAIGGGGTVSNVSVQNKGIALLDNNTRVWVTETDFGGIATKVMASYRL
jgi:hypothetical protein